MNFLERLVSEWYAYQGYFVRTNIVFGKRAQGGYEGEMDVVAFDPKQRILLHLETDGSASSWANIQERLRKKFPAAELHYHSIFGSDFQSVRKVAVAGFAQPRKPVNFGYRIELLLVPQLITQIKEKIKHTDPDTAAIPEVYSLLRAIQFVLWFPRREP